MKRYSQPSLTHPGRTLVIWMFVLCLGGFAMAVFPQMRLNPTFRSMIMADDPDRAADGRAKEIFGDDEMIAIAVENPAGIYNIPTLSLIDALTIEIEKIEGVREVYSLTRVDNIRGQGGTLLTDDLITELPKTPEDLQRIERDADENPLYLNSIIAADKKVAGINVEIDLKFSTSSDHERITKEVYRIVDSLEKTKPSGVRFYVTGYPVGSYTGGIMMLQDMVVFGGASMMMLLIVMWLVFRAWQGVVGTMLVVMCSLAMSYGAMSAFGVSVTMPLSAVMVYLTAIGMQYSTYVGFAYREEVLRDRAHGRPPREHRFVIGEAMRGVRGSVVLSVITTAIGFSSMYVNRVPDLKTMGMFLVIGLITTGIATITIFPALFAKFPFDVPPGNRQHRRLQAVIDRIGKTAVTRPRLMLTISALLFASGVFGFTQLDTNTDVMHYFKESSDIRKSENFVRARMAGTTYLQAVVSADQLDTFKEPENLKKLEAIQAFANTLPHVTKTISHADHIKLMNRALRGGAAAEYRIPDNRNAVEQYLLLHNDPDDFRLVIDSDYKNASMMIRMDTMASAVQRETEKKLEAFMKTQFPQWTVNLVGTNLLTHRAFDEMATSMLKSLGIATLLIWLVMVIGLGSLKLGTLSLVPNLAPSVLVYSILPLIGHSLDPPTAVTGAVALGILADDTIHFFKTWIRNRRAPGADAVNAVTHTLAEIGKPMVLSSFIVACGFAIMLFSRYGTLVWIGIMMCIVTTTAAVWELVCTPAMLRLLGGRARKAVSPQLGNLGELRPVAADVQRTSLDKYSDTEIATLPTADFLALAGKTVVARGGAPGTRRVLVELDIRSTDRVLVIGAGAGETAFTLLSNDPGVHVTAVDRSAFLIEEVRRHAKAIGTGERLELVHSAEPHTLPFEDGKFDVVIIESAATHPDAAQLFGEVRRVLKPGGRVGLHELCWFTKPSSELEATTTSVVFGAAPGDAKFLTQAEWEQALKSHGFEIGFADQYPRSFLSWSGMREDEGTVGAVRLFRRFTSRPAARTRLARMRKFLASHEDAVGYTVTVAKKPA